VSYISRQVYPDKEIVLIGVGQIGLDSPSLTNQIIEQEKPDIICIDLDVARARILADESQWESLSIREVIRDNLLTALMLNLLLAAYQRALKDASVSMPGDEIYEAANVAESLSIPVVFVDRDLHITFARTSRAINFREKIKLLLAAIKRLFRFKKATDEILANLGSSDVMTAFLREATNLSPNLATPLIDERDAYTAAKIITASGKKVLAILGAGRVTGVYEKLGAAPQEDIDELENVSPISPLSKWSKRLVPVALLIGLLYLTISQGKEFIRENLAFWIAANSFFTGLGAILAGAHILSIITAVVVAPFSPLIPAGPGTVAAIVQLIVRPPLVKDFQTFPDDITHLRQWRRNRILKIVLVLVLCGLGSIIGTLLGTSRILFSLLSID
jgi:pheromone shutdown-related protein TraB